MRNYYEILEVSENASQEVIELAYKALVKKYHPDTQPQEKVAWAEAEFKQIQEAYFILSDPSLRAQYNLKLGIGSDVLKQYDNLYKENQKLKEEVNTLKTDNSKNSKWFFKKRKSKSMYNTSVLKELPSLNDMFKSIKTALTNEKNKPKEERSKDLLAFILTIVIVGLIVFMFIKIPALNKILFPEF